MKPITAFVLRQLTFMVMAFLFFYITAVMLTGNWNITLWSDVSVFFFDAIWVITSVMMHTAWYDLKK